MRTKDMIAEINEVMNAMIPEDKALNPQLKIEINKVLDRYYRISLLNEKVGSSSVKSVINKFIKKAKKEERSDLRRTFVFNADGGQYFVWEGYYIVRKSGVLDLPEILVGREDRDRTEALIKNIFSTCQSEDLVERYKLDLSELKKELKIAKDFSRVQCYVKIISSRGAAFFDLKLLVDMLNLMGERFAYIYPRGPERISYLVPTEPNGEAGIISSINGRVEEPVIIYEAERNVRNDEQIRKN